MKYIFLFLIISIKVLSQDISGAETNMFFEKHYRVKAPFIPSNLYFVNERVPIENQDILERFDKEILVNTYYHSKAILILKRSKKYFPIIEKFLKENNIPDDFKYLAIAESGLENVTSPAGAKGFWQFMPKTGKAYGLEINDEIDERYHLEKSTQAACDYLNKLYNQFNNWTLAAAAYNMGEYGLKKQIEKQKVTNYYNLKLNNETSRYIFRIIAYKLIDQNPKLYGFDLMKKDFYKPLKTLNLEITKTIDNVAQYSLSLGTNYNIIKYLNPWILKNKMEVKNKTYIIKLPLGLSLQNK